MATTPAETADAIIRLLCERGTGDYIGESISQLEHCLQCAHSAAEAGEYMLQLYPSIYVSFRCAGTSSCFG
jgi:predicted HD phosphohydrolase